MEFYESVSVDEWNPEDFGIVVFYFFACKYPFWASDEWQQNACPKTWQKYAYQTSIYLLILAVERENQNFL